jgi:lipopolysaccharide heptosyltransferase II
MKENWAGCKNILIVRADNMGDLLMSSPAIRAVKETINCKITVLTSSMGKGIAHFIPEIDEVIVCDLPWIKTNENFNSHDYFALVETLRAAKYDGAIVFTVYSQNPLPSAMLVYLSEIPKRLAYCRENPYQLLTDWVPEKEPYTFVRHQVRRDLDLVAHINCRTTDEGLSLKTDRSCWQQLKDKLSGLGIHENKKWIIIHAGVSEQKRRYSLENWVAAGKLLLSEFSCQLLLTGSSSESKLTDKITTAIGEDAFSLAGKLNLEEFITLIKHSALVISVNTGTIHIAAATGIPIIVLYALTNPQHTPWRVQGEVLPFNVDEHLKSKNEVIKYVNDNLFSSDVSCPSPEDINEAAKRILNQEDVQFIPEIIISTHTELQTIGKFSWLPGDRIVQSPPH